MEAPMNSSWPSPAKWGKDQATGRTRGIGWGKEGQGPPWRWGSLLGCFSNNLASSCIVYTLPFSPAHSAWYFQVQFISCLPQNVFLGVLFPTISPYHIFYMSVVTFSPVSQWFVCLRHGDEGSLTASTLNLIPSIILACSPGLSTQEALTDNALDEWMDGRWMDGWMTAVLPMRWISKLGCLMYKDFWPHREVTSEAPSLNSWRSCKSQSATSPCLSHSSSLPQCALTREAHD
jgi:hypothetical protein